MDEETQSREIARLDYEQLKADASDRIKYQVEFAHGALRGLTLGNGGAIIALFTFIGNSDPAGRYDSELIWWAFTLFVIGLFATFVAAFGAFFSQAFYMDSSMSEGWTKQSEMFGGKDKYDHLKAYGRGELSERVGIGAAFVALAAFAGGSGCALAGVLP